MDMQLLPEDENEKRERNFYLIVWNYICYLFYFIINFEGDYIFNLIIPFAYRRKMYESFRMS